MMLEYAGDMTREQRDKTARKVCVDYRTVLPLVRLDGRSRMSRRVEQLRRKFIAALGGSDAISPTLAERVAVAAQRMAIAEEARAGYLEDRSIGLGHVIRAERNADTAVKALGIVEKAKPKPTLRERLVAEVKVAAT
jgi:hypothetical protein